MKKYIFSGLLLMASASAFAQMQVDKQIQMTGGTTNDRRITNISNASAVTPVNTDAINIATFQSNYTNYGAATFATGTYTFALTPAPAQYWEGMIVSFKAGAINTGPTNLNISTLGNRAIVKAGGQALVAGDIRANQMVTAIYNLGSTRFEIIGSGGIAGWSTLGNTGTASATNFLGTTDAQSLVFRANNTERMSILSTGEVVVGNTTSPTGDVFSAYGNYPINGYSTSAGGIGVFGTSAGGTSFGGFFTKTTAGGAGVVVRSGTGTPTFLANSGGSFSSATGVGTYVTSEAAASFAGQFIKTTDGAGAGVIVRNGTGALTYILGSGGSFSSTSSIGVYGVASTTVSATGVLGRGNGTEGVGVQGVTDRTGLQSGIGVMGNNTTDAGTFLTGQSVGGSFTGTNYGTFSVATQTANATDHAAYIGNFSEGGTARTVYIGGRIGGTNYKILSTGAASVSTTMDTRDGERILFAPESPENWFFDIGEVKLTNGKARVELDPIFFDCISHEKPFKVFVQGAENTLGAIRIKSRGENWFELEDVGGASNGTVLFNIYAIWKGKENLRLPKYVNNIKVEKVKNKEEKTALDIKMTETKIGVKTLNR